MKTRILKLTILFITVLGESAFGIGCGTSSSTFQYAECPIASNVASVIIVSSDEEGHACQQDYDWGIHPGRAVWVKYHCQIDFDPIYGPTVPDNIRFPVQPLQGSYTYAGYRVAVSARTALCKSKCDQPTIIPNSNPLPGDIPNSLIKPLAPYVCNPRGAPYYDWLCEQPIEPPTSLILAAIAKELPVQMDFGKPVADPIETMYYPPSTVATGEANWQVEQPIRVQNNEGTWSTFSQSKLFVLLKLNGTFDTIFLQSDAVRQLEIMSDRSKIETSDVSISDDGHTDTNEIVGVSYKGIYQLNP